jgi:hypothetical protein
MQAGLAGMRLGSAGASTLSFDATRTFVVAATQFAGLHTRDAEYTSTQNAWVGDILKKHALDARFSDALACEFGAVTSYRHNWRADQNQALRDVPCRHAE